MRRPIKAMVRQTFFDFDLKNSKKWVPEMISSPVLIGGSGAACYFSVKEKLVRPFLENYIFITDHHILEELSALVA